MDSSSIQRTRRKQTGCWVRPLPVRRVCPQGFSQFRNRHQNLPLRRGSTTSPHLASPTPALCLGTITNPAEAIDGLVLSSVRQAKGPGDAAFRGSRWGPRTGGLARQKARVPLQQPAWGTSRNAQGAVRAHHRLDSCPISNSRPTRESQVRSPERSRPPSGAPEPLPLPLPDSQPHKLGTQLCSRGGALCFHMQNKGGAGTTHFGPCPL